MTEALPRLLSSAIRCRHSVDITIAPSYSVCLRANVRKLARPCCLGYLCCHHLHLVLSGRQERESTLPSKTHSTYTKPNINRRHRMNSSTYLRPRSTALATTHGTRRSQHRQACTKITFTRRKGLSNTTFQISGCQAAVADPRLQHKKSQSSECHRTGLHLLQNPPDPAVDPASRTWSVEGRGPTSKAQ